MKSTTQNWESSASSGAVPLMFGKPGPVDYVQPYRDLYAQGVRLFHVDATPTEDIYYTQLRAWVAPDRFDYSAQENGWRRLVEACPDAKFCLRLYIAPPPWWDENHPDELQCYADGRREHTFLHTERRTLPSLASALWRRDAATALTQFLTWLETSNWAEKVWGFMLCYGITWEWGILGSHDWVDYSQPMQSEFQHWLKRHYRDVETLRAAWDDGEISFETASIPSPDARQRSDGELRTFPRDRAAYDFQRCLSQTNAEALMSLARAVRAHSGSRYKLGTFYGYTLTARENNDFVCQVGAGGLHGGHHALSSVLRSGLLDYLGSPYIYVNRDLGEGTLMPHFPLASVHVHGLRGYQENDLYTFTNPPLTARRNSIGVTTNFADSILHQRLALVQALCDGTSFWWTDLIEKSAGREVSNYSDAGMLEEIGRHSELFSELSRPAHAPAQIALILDEAAKDALGFDSKLFLREVYEQLPQWAWCGAPFDVWLADDITEENMRPYRLTYVFAPYLEAARRAQMRAALCNGGRTVWWAPFSGWLTENGPNSAEFESLTGFSEVEPPAFPTRRERGDWVSLYGSCAGLSSEKLAELAAVAGVHLYGAAPLQVLAGTGLVGLHTRRAGKYQLHFPIESAWREVFSDVTVPQSRFEIELETHAVALFQGVAAGSAEK